MPERERVRVIDLREEEEKRSTMRENKRGQIRTSKSWKLKALVNWVKIEKLLALMKIGWEIEVLGKSNGCLDPN